MVEQAHPLQGSAADAGQYPDAASSSGPRMQTSQSYVPSSSALPNSPSHTKEDRDRDISPSQQQQQYLPSPSRLEGHAQSRSQNRSRNDPSRDGPRSSYYFGPPSRTAAFGTPPMGVIGRDKPREIVRVERDYTGGELCQFHSAFPLELEGRISPTAFSETINDINILLISAHDPAFGCLDNTLSVLTLYLSPLVLGSRYAREMAKLQKLLESVNAETFNPAGLNILPPRRSAFLFIEIEYY